MFEWVLVPAPSTTGARCNYKWVAREKLQRTRKNGNFSYCIHLFIAPFSALKRELSNSYIYTLRLNFHPFGPKCVNLISWKSANSVDGISTFTIAYLWCLPFQANSDLPGAFSFHFLQICLKLKVTCGSLVHYLNVAYWCSFDNFLGVSLLENNTLYCLENRCFTVVRKGKM